MVQFGVDGAPYFLMVSIVIEFHYLQIIFFVLPVVIVVEIPIVVLVIHHFDFIVQQSHCFYFVV